VTSEQMNVAIAEWAGTLRNFYCGHCREERYNVDSQRHFHFVNGRYEWFCNYCDKGPLHRDCPNYAGDLNTIHEAEERLTSGQICRYQGLLHKGVWWSAVHATAPQRAEALLRTIGKWVES
jgi:hypothetical protein